MDLTQHVCGAQLYMYQMLKAVSFMHARRIMHRDLKPQKILVHRASDTIKVTGFGLARSFTPPIRPYTHEARPTVVTHGQHIASHTSGVLTLQHPRATMVHYCSHVML